MFSDVELTVACAKALLEKLPEFDVIVTAEAKGIPLAYEMSRQSGKRYIPARKGPKLYMEKPVIVEDKSITTEAVQKLVICLLYTSPYVCAMFTAAPFDTYWKKRGRGCDNEPRGGFLQLFYFGLCRFGGEFGAFVHQ